MELILNFFFICFQVFSSALVWFSFDGLQYQSNPEKIEVTEEIKTSSISVSIPLLSRVAKFIKLELKQKSKWLMISEVNFETRKIQLCAIPACKLYLIFKKAVNFSLDFYLLFVK